MRDLFDLLQDPSRIDWYTLITAVTQVLGLLTIPSVLLRRRGRPKAALAWLLALFALPLVGVVSWWAVGRTNIERKQRKRERSKQQFAEQHGPPHSEEGTPFERWLPPRALGDSIFPSNGNGVELLFDGAAAYPAMERAILAAKRSIHAEFYIWHDDEAGRRLRDQLADKARQGVTVRVLVDAWGTPRFIGKFSKPLLKAGAQVRAFMPSKLYPLRAPRLNFINHRKILVIDEEIAFTGGMNIGNEYASEWRDMMARIEGPAVRALEHVFLDDWYFASGERVDHIEFEHSPPCGDIACAVIASGPDREAWIHDSLFTALTRSERRIWLVTPYFIPSLALQAAVRTAADRGVDVRIVLPSVSDVPVVKWASRSYYPELVDAGVRMYEYRNTMIHAKALLVDDTLSAVGSANVDTRSFRLSFEIGCFFHSERINGRLAQWFESLVEQSDEITYDDLEARSTIHKLLESAAHLASPLL